MNAKLESVAARAANGWQRAGSKFDFEVLAMPGGSVIAPALWVYSMLVSALKRPDSTTAQSATSGLDVGARRAPDEEAGATAEKERARYAKARDSDAGLHCDWSGCHCT